jgi:hypothetical protein
MRLFSRPTRKTAASMTRLPPAPAELASITTRRIEITVEREWSEAVFPARQDDVPADAADKAREAEGSGRLR